MIKANIFLKGNENQTYTTFNALNIVTEFYTLPLI